MNDPLFFTVLIVRQKQSTKEKKKIFSTPYTQCLILAKGIFLKKVLYLCKYSFKIVSSFKRGLYRSLFLISQVCYTEKCQPMKDRYIKKKDKLGEYIHFDKNLIDTMFFVICRSQIFIPDKRGKCFF